ncbi:cell division protein PerM [Paeniglutamicibacter sp. R2-26]|uniref:cell division protein PerM n=1 Tax=Paeniglutamicibacter sp. R2-26 TaxID=3144417 RepID=UPI003EE71A11
MNEKKKKPPAAAALNAARERLTAGWPMPLFLQGAFELLQAALFSAFLVVIPWMAVWFSGGFADRSIESVLKMSGQMWLLIHGVPLQLLQVGTGADPSHAPAVLNLVPLGLTLIPFFLCWRAGRRIARASYTDQLWQGILGALGVYLLCGLFTGFLVNNDEARTTLLMASTIPLVSAGAGVIIGARREAGSWGRLIGFDAAAWISKTSQHSRWAGSYLWAVVCGGTLAYMMTFGLAALLLTVNLGLHWVDISNVYQQLRPGPIGSAVLTLGQLGVMPNLVLWTLAWLTGGGFTFGVGSTISPLETTVGPLPAVPLLAALPSGDLTYAWVFMLLPVLAGFMAGWYFLRVGENHFDDWISLRVRSRWVSLGLSTVVLGIAVGATAGILSLAGSWLASGSLGIGRFTEIGPNILLTALFLAAEVAIGTAIGYLVSPLLEHDPVLGV